MPGVWTPTSPLAHAVVAAGFLYDPDQDIIYSRLDAAQRLLGYGFGYDVAAPGMNTILDCETIFFDYDGKHWVIYLWKGQYGLESGCEVGVYTRPIGSSGLGYDLLDATVGQRPGDPVPSHNLFYDCASDDDMLVLSTVLHRDGAVLFTRGPERHWWLTGFKWGVLSDPRQLTVDVSITLKDDAMRDAFLGGIAGRSYANLQVNGTTVSFTFDEPFSVPQPPTPTSVRDAVMAANQEIVDTYNALGFPNNDPNLVDAEFLSVVGLSVLRLVDFDGLVASQLAVQLGVDAAALIAALSDGFGVAASQIETWLNSVALAFPTWVTMVERYLGLPLDFSCYVMIDNTAGASDLLLISSSAISGSYALSPPTRVPQGAVARFVIQDPKPSIFGSSGTVTYTYCDSALAMSTVMFTFECPTGFAANRAASSQAGWACRAKSEDADRQWSASVPPGGHPLYVSFVLDGAEPAEGSRRHVVATRKDGRGDITHLCGGSDVSWGPVPVAEAITQIRSRSVVYFTGSDGQTSLVRVIDGRSGPYLRTDPDPSTANNLDQLPDC